MKVIKNSLTIDTKNYPYDKLGNLDELLFMDIETTGFLASSSKLYLIGCGYYKDGSFHSIQWFSEEDSDEELLLYHFFNFASDYKKLIHFNGNRFDVPYLEAKCQEYNLPYDFKKLEGIDLYKRLAPYKSFLHLENMRQKSIEDFLGVERDDTYDGGQLISVYEEYLSSPSEFLLQLLLSHNYDDVKGLISIVPALAFVDMFNEPIKVEKAGRNPYRDSEGNVCNEIIMDLRLPSPLPFQYSYGWTDCYFIGSEKKAKIRIALVEGELKFFYPNYKEYYYIPAEDMSVHKSVASYVDPGHRQPAKASTCYCKKTGAFLPQWDPLFEPIFRENYNDKTMYFELNDEFKKNSKAFTRYAEHLLKIMANPDI